MIYAKRENSLNSLKKFFKIYQIPSLTKNSPLVQFVGTLVSEMKTFSSTLPVFLDNNSPHYHKTTLLLIDLAVKFRNLVL